MDMGTGLPIAMSADDGLFYRIFREISGIETEGLHDILKITKISLKLNGNMIN